MSCAFARSGIHLHAHSARLSSKMIQMRTLYATPATPSRMTTQRLDQFHGKNSCILVYGSGLGGPKPKYCSVEFLMACGLWLASLKNTL